VLGIAAFAAPSVLHDYSKEPCDQPCADPKGLVYAAAKSMVKHLDEAL